MQHDARDLGPIGVICFCIEEAYIGDEVFRVVTYTDGDVSTPRERLSGSPQGRS